MNYLEMNKLSLNEGLFKDIDKEIVNVDDPDYEQKIKDQTFNNFQEHDRILRIKKEMIDWLCGHVNIFCSSIPTRFLTPSDEDKFFEISFTNSGDPFINLKVPSHLNLFGVIFSVENQGRFNEKGELPYKFKLCEGSFSISHSAHNSAEKSWDELRSFKNFPTTIYENCRVSGNKYRDNRNKVYLSNNLSTLPEGIQIGRDLDITYIGITSLEGMPNNIKVGNKFNLSHNELKSLKGWNPTFKFGDSTTRYTPVTTLDLSDNTSLESIADLPDNFSCDIIDLEYCGIRDGRGFSTGLNAGYLYLMHNKLTTEGLTKYPLPRDMKVKCVKIGPQRALVGMNVNVYLKKDPDNPILIPAGIETIHIWNVIEGPECDDRFDDNGRPLTKQLDESILYEGSFKDLDKNIVSVDDPDYEQKVKDQTFNDFKEADHKKRKTVIEEWILEHIFHSSYYTGPNHMLSDLPFKAYEVDNNYEIHLYSEGIKNNAPVETDAFRISVSDSPSIPYKIAECTANLVILKNDPKHPDVESTLTSLKNLPDELPLTLTVGPKSLRTLEGCPKTIHGDFDISNCSNIESLEGGPEYVGGFMDCSHCSLTNLEGCPDHVGRQFFANYNNINDLYWYPESGFYGPFNIEQNALLPEQITDFMNMHPWIKMSSYPYDQDEAKVKRIEDSYRREYSVNGMNNFDVY